MGEAALKLGTLSAEQYLAEEQARAYKCEYVDGQVYAFAGATDRHNLVVTNIVGQLWSATRGGPCRVYSSDMKLRVQTDFTHRFYYPDVMVVCKQDNVNRLYKAAPSLLAEVMSPSTASTDRREKRVAYQSIPELSAYLIVDPDERHVEHYRRDADGSWWLHEYRDGGVVTLPDLQLELTLDDIYEEL